MLNIEAAKKNVPESGRAEKKPQNRCQKAASEGTWFTRTEAMKS